jgi:hypothetical protein
MHFGLEVRVRLCYVYRYKLARPVSSWVPPSDQMNTSILKEGCPGPVVATFD